MSSFFRKGDLSHNEKVEKAYKCFKSDFVQLLFPGGIKQADRIIVSLSKLYGVQLEKCSAKQYYDILSTYSFVFVRKVVTFTSDKIIISGLLIEYSSFIKNEYIACETLGFTELNIKNNNFALDTMENINEFNQIVSNLFETNTEYFSKAEEIKHNEKTFISVSKTFWNALSRCYDSLIPQLFDSLVKVLVDNNVFLGCNSYISVDINNVSKSLIPMLFLWNFYAGTFWIALIENNIDYLNNETLIKEILTGNISNTLQELAEPYEEKLILSNQVDEYYYANINKLFCGYSLYGYNDLTFEEISNICNDSMIRNALLLCDYLLYYRQFEEIATIDKIKKLKSISVLNTKNDILLYSNLFETAKKQCIFIFDEVKKLINNEISNKRLDSVVEENSSNNFPADLMEIYKKLSKEKKSLNGSELNFIVEDFINRGEVFNGSHGTYIISFDCTNSKLDGVLIIDEKNKKIKLFEVLKNYGTKLKVNYAENTKLYYLNCSFSKIEEVVKSSVSEKNEELKQSNVSEKIEKLEKIDDLRKRDIITEEEFINLKKEILNA